VHSTNATTGAYHHDVTQHYTLVTTSVHCTKITGHIFTSTRDSWHKLSIHNVRFAFVQAQCNGTLKQQRRDGQSGEPTGIHTELTMTLRR